MGKPEVREHLIVLFPSLSTLVLDFSPPPCLLPFSGVTPRDLEIWCLDPIPQGPGVLASPLYGCVSPSASKTEKPGLQPPPPSGTHLFLPAPLLQITNRAKSRYTRGYSCWRLVSLREAPPLESADGGRRG
ncbi:hypothetical protein HJG60_009023 [Phyllostomus discolor]|uniref:Uncharacterized protein n=1 Tax=Phyllostomus discolor TaxID=89673 RepID=A0A834DFN5_9CHIR|nr:hypothetical protein HJG60_009023 [Phyllostomus discolor]